MPAYASEGTTVLRNPESNTIQMPQALTFRNILYLVKIQDPVTWETYINQRVKIY